MKRLFSKALLTLGLVQHSRQSQTRRLRIHTLGAVGQGTIAKGSLHAQSSPRRRVHQPLQVQEAVDSQNMAHHHCPDDVRCGNVGLGSAIAGLLEVGFQGQTMAGVVLNLAGMRPLLAGWLLFAPQNQQLSVGCEDLAQSVLKGAAGFDAPADVVHPLYGDAFDAALPLRHESEKPDGWHSPEAQWKVGLRQRQ